jgi:hypothetical protein
MLHAALEPFAVEAAQALCHAASEGEEVPFELARCGAPGRPSLYCYRPLTAEFIRSHLGLLHGLRSAADATRALEVTGGAEGYLRARGRSVAGATARQMATVALECLLDRLFEERSDFTHDPARFETAYEELERSLYAASAVSEIVGRLFGLELDPSSDTLPLGAELAIVRPERMMDPPPRDASDQGEGPDEALLIVLRVRHDRLGRAPVALARQRFRKILCALRLFERGSFALAPVGFSRVDGGAWMPAAIGGGGRPGEPVRVAAAQEDELRAFCNLVARRLPSAAFETSGSGELSWALRRFELGCERPVPLEALTDYLLALRALLEPEGPDSGRLAQRLAVICAPPSARAELAERVAKAISLERALLAGLAAPGQPGARLAEEIGEHLRAILRDVLCGHLDSDVAAVADRLLSEAVALAA